MGRTWPGSSASRALPQELAMPNHQTRGQTPAGQEFTQQP